MNNNYLDKKKLKNDEFNIINLIKNKNNLNFELNNQLDMINKNNNEINKEINKEISKYITIDNSIFYTF